MVGSEHSTCVEAAVSMTVEHIFTKSKKIVLRKSISHGSRIKLLDLVYSVNTRAEFFKMHIRGYHNYIKSGKPITVGVPGGEKILIDPNHRLKFSTGNPQAGTPQTGYRGHAFTFRVPMNNMSFGDFKKTCIRQIEMISDFNIRILIRNIIKRFKLVGGKVRFERTDPGTAIFEIRSSKTLAKVFGFPGQNCDVADDGTTTFSKFLKNCDKTTAQGHLHFPSKKLVGIKCLQVDLSKHFDNNLCTFFIKKTNNFSAYKQLDTATLFKLTPTNHNALTLSWPKYIQIKNITLAIET